MVSQVQTEAHGMSRAATRLHPTRWPRCQWPRSLSLQPPARHAPATGPVLGAFFLRILMRPALWPFGLYSKAKCQKPLKGRTLPKTGTPSLMVKERWSGLSEILQPPTHVCKAPSLAALIKIATHAQVAAPTPFPALIFPIVPTTV